MKTAIIMLAEDSNDSSLLTVITTIRRTVRRALGTYDPDCFTTYHPSRQFQLIDDYTALCRIHRVLGKNHPDQFKHKRLRGVAKEITTSIRLKEEYYRECERKGEWN